MAYIEKRFYEIWKQMNVEGIGVSERERARLAVWDYPVSDRYTKILHQMHLTGLPLTFEEGIRRVKKSKSAQEGFAFLADATKVKYAAMIDCDLRQVGNEFSRKPLALAVRENSTLKDELSSAILKLLNQRKLEELKEKWWTENKERRGDCDYDRKSNDGISINNIGGVFVVIFVGVGLASVTLLGEWLWRRYHAPNIRTTAIVRIKDRHLQPGYSGPQQQTPSHPSSNACAHLPPFATQYGGIGSSMHMPAFSSALAGMYERPRTMLPIS